MFVLSMNVVNLLFSFLYSKHLFQLLRSTNIKFYPWNKKSCWKRTWIATGGHIHVFSAKTSTDWWWYHCCTCGCHDTIRTKSSLVHFQLGYLSRSQMVTRHSFLVSNVVGTLWSLSCLESIHARIMVRTKRHAKFWFAASRSTRQTSTIVDHSWWFWHQI